MKQTTMPHHRLGARAKFRLQQSKRVNNSATLAAKFPRLKSLKVDLEYYTADRSIRTSRIKYAVNLDHAKSVLRFDCLNRECVRGDFDLSDLLADAVAARRKVVSGEMRCHGWRNKDEIKKVYCRNILRYKLQLGY